ncbi:MAG: SDR family oxidoreductase [Nitrososphaerota archaeon]|jgi:3-oxoacyl-[acyl-carrier protein] reductase|nr:SDR family oxidoreductase [Nitrososphaerota archaeon]
MSQHRILVTGSSSGIGRACAELFAKCGDFVLGVDRVAPIDAQFHSVVGDITSDQTLEEIEKSLSLDTGLDTLVNCAAIVNEDDPWKLTAQDWLQTYEVNVVSAYRLTVKMLPFLKVSKNASIVNIGSIAGQRSGKFSSPCYSVSKAALIALSRSFARLLASDGIRVNCVNPGITATPMIDHWDATQRNEAVDSVPLGRLGIAEDIAAAVAFLASAEASYVTGTQFDVNGGLHMI